MKTHPGRSIPLTDGEPARPDARVSAEDVEAPLAEAKVLGDVKHLHRLLEGPRLRLLVDDEVDVDVGVDKVAVGGPADGALRGEMEILKIKFQSWALLVFLKFFNNEK